MATVEVDRLLGKQVMTGDGRHWTIIKVEPVTYMSGTNGPMRTIKQTMVRMDCTDHAPRAVLDLPLTLVIGALEYGLLEEV